MSDSYTSVNFGTLEQVEAQFRLAYRAMIDELADMDSALQSSLATWDGSTQATYHECKRKWDSEAAHVGAIIDKLGVVIRDAHTNYTTAERTGQNIWGG